jgi:hypothetical protein
MRKFNAALAGAVILSGVSIAHATIYSEPPGSSSFGSRNPPPAGTQEFATDFFNGTYTYYYDNPAFGRTINKADPGPSNVFGSEFYNQIRPILRGNTNNGGGDVDLFKVTVANPNYFSAWTGRLSTTTNNILLTLFKTDGTAVAASLGAAQVGALNIVANTFPTSAAPLNPSDPAIITGTGLGLTAGDYILGVSTYIPASGKGQPKNNAGQNIFNLVAGTVVTPNALSDIKLSTDPLKGWDLYGYDAGTIGSFDPDLDELLGPTSFTAGNAAIINVYIPEPTSFGAAATGAMVALTRRARRKA